MSRGTGGAALPHLRTPPPGPRSRRLLHSLQGVESRNVTWVGEDFPVVWERARGANVRDVDGNRYVDLTGAFGVAAVGHSAPEVVRAIRRESGRLIHGMGDVHPPRLKVELLRRLCAVAPWGDETRAVLSSGGAEAVEIALKTALLATGRPGVVAFDGGYHGLTMGALAATARSDFRTPFRSRLYEGVGWAPWPESVEAVAGALDEFRRLLAGPEGGDPVGAVIVEPIQGRAGIRVPPPGFLGEVVRLAHEAGALVIFDEIFTGMGRTGALFAFQQEPGLLPDLLCVGKALGGGMPISACLAPRAVMDAWPRSGGEALHTSTFLGHPLACAAALAVLRILEDGELIRRAGEVGAWHAARLRAALSGFEGVAAVRGRGLFLGVELQGAGSGMRLTTHALSRGFLTLPAGPAGEVLEITPPLVISERQLEVSVDVLGEGLEERRHGDGPE